jgi:uncharacterized protein YndB with AHSA1/START domain
MKEKFIARVSTTIHKPTSVVWDALINPELIRQYLFGTEAVSDWKVGSSLQFKGTWDGKSYLDKGTILKFELEKELQYTYLSSMSGLKDLPENYNKITFKLIPDNKSTMLELEQDNIDSEKSKNHSEQNWQSVLNTLKDLLEK